MPRSRETPDYPLRRTVALSMAILAAAGVYHEVSDGVNNIRASNRIYQQLTKPDALQRYQEGDIDPSKVVVVTATHSSTADSLAVELYGTGVDYRPMGDEIAAQVGINGVQPGEQVVVPRHGLSANPSELAKGKV